MLTIREFGCWFEAGEFSQLKVPDYHRSFDWDSTYISETLSMIERVVTDDSSKKCIYLQEISISSNLFPQYERDDNVLEIVDGAHRILTFVLILCAAKNQAWQPRLGATLDPVKVMESDPIISDITRFLIHDATGEIQNHKFVASEMDQDMEVLAAIIDGEQIPADNHSLLPAVYHQIKFWVRSLKKKSLSMEQLTEFLMDRVVFNINFVESPKDALDIYEDRNT